MAGCFVTKRSSNGTYPRQPMVCCMSFGLCVEAERGFGRDIVQRVEDLEVAKTSEHVSR